jgi:hypothetical protein
LSKGRNIQELSVGDRSVGETSTLHQENSLQINLVKCVFADAAVEFVEFLGHRVDQHGA